MRILTIAILATAFFPVSVSASDIGTYRAGNSYMSVPAQSPDQCNSQCKGDARCKGWNFVRVAPEQMICEFNAVRVAPIASAISISGDNLSAGPSYNLVQGGERTTRVGYVPAAQSYSQNRSQMSAPKAVTQPRRRFIRQAPQPKIMPQRAAQQRPAQMFRPQLDTAGPARPYPMTTRQTQQAPRQAVSPAISQFKPMLDASAAPITEQPYAAPAPQPVSAPELPASAQMQPPPPTVPSLSQMPSNTPSPSIESGLAGGPIAGNLPRNSSLYGSLYDDVKAPRTLGAMDIPVDPDAPISTVKSVPVDGRKTAPY